MGNIQLDDTELWSRSLKGDGDAFGLLFDRHHGRIFRHAYRLIPISHDVEDVVALAFLELWRRKEKVRLVDSSILPWLLVTTTNVSRNARRAAFRYRKLLNSLPRADDAPDPLDEVLSRHPLDAVDHELAAALRGLGAIDRQLVSLVVLEGYPISAAATVLGLTPSAAKTRMFRVRERLKAVMGRPNKIIAANEMTNGVQP
ncbi:RNA polymerase sigma-70 factor (ECF subfamily) [Arthrobacter stackebrandtii]|uniref:RNA polymerase sigma-70 factor (ECF subfamily) n=1 Tax=Arthrobacter stackebrandtii TaxID=272161 RepID=A0ABS4YWI2_9MICC|nr:RNA polymerase sigma factor [Arthrobacter stackebrandtii]MBP2413089.1 RNA polymerase sigma-70 factor (ECF subfamily) [Arthrobacter stackebrandtii]PYH01141.1 sigma-70 family RNA polymerase sigma factor [Arthrobacter stackebrandtii]